MTDAVRRALRTAAQTFIGVFGLASLGFLNDVQQWATSHGGDFPSVNPLGKAAAGGAAAAAAGVVSLALNWAEDSPKVRFPALLKARPSAGRNPVTVDPAGAPSKKAAKKPAAKQQS